MAKERVGEIRITKRIIQIGHQVYPLANISRVQTLRLVWAGRRATFYPLLEITIILLVVGAIIGAAVVALPGLHLRLSGGAVESVRQAVAVVAVLVGARIAYLLIVLLYRLLVRRTIYALVLETAGTQYTALSGTDRDEIHRIEGEIVDAIEDPPAYERTVLVGGDLVLGDKFTGGKYQQFGTDSRMTFNR